MIEKLKNIKILEQKIEQQEEYIQRLRESLISSSMSSDAERVQSSHNNDKFASLIIKIGEEEQKLSDIQCEYSMLRSECVTMLENLPDLREKEVLYRRFIDWKNNNSFTQIADNMNYSRRHVIRLYKSAISHYTVT